MVKRCELFGCMHAKIFLLLLLFSGICAGCLGKDPLEARVDKLVRNLGNEDLDVGYASAYALIDIGEPSVDSLIKALKDEDPQVRSLAAYSLGRIGEPRASKALIKTLEDPEPEVRMNSTEALGNLGAAEAVDPLIELLKDDDDRVVVNSIFALEQLKAPEAVGPLLEFLNQDNKEVSRRAISALRAIGDPKAVDPLIELFSDEELGEYAADAVGESGDEEAVEKLLKLLDSRDPKVRVNSIYALIGTQNPDSNYALIGIQDPDLVLPIVGMLDDRDKEVRRAAVFALGRFGREEASLTEQPLIKALGDPEEDVRMAAIRALGNAGGKEAVAPLVELLHLETSGVSGASAGSDEDVREAGSVKLADWYVKREVVRSLVEIGDPGAVEPLILLLGDEYYRIRQFAAQGLGKLGDQGAVEPLLKALETERESEVRVAEVRALGELGGPEAIEGLRRISVDMEEYRYVRTSAEEALAKLEGGGEENSSSTS
ncbi:HEAT repeat domain-containing protein [Methanosarcina sp. T3]|uniref:HEAT repeat domain-containing protein n=1 Tax=Methanosarcina sp. T3 TaxID=3439062 RepID=UPI003F84D9EB